MIGARGGQVNAIWRTWGAAPLERPVRAPANHDLSRRAADAATNGGRTLVLFPGALGDFVSFHPALEVLSARSRRLRILVRGGLGDLLPEGPSAPRVGSLEAPEVSRLFVEGAGAEPRVRRFFGSYDAIYSWTGAKDPVFMRNLRAVARVEPRLFPFRPPGTAVRWSEYYLACVGAGAERLVSARLRFKPAAVDWAEELWRAQGLSTRAVLAVTPGSGAVRKNWPLARFMEVCRWWRGETGGVPVVLLGPAEEERGMEEAIPADTARVFKGLSLARLAALLARCNAYVGNDSGPTHLAAGLGVPTVAVFRVTDPREWTPWGAKVTVVTPDGLPDPCPDAAPHGEVGTGKVVRALARYVGESRG